MTTRLAAVCAQPALVRQAVGRVKPSDRPLPVGQPRCAGTARLVVRVSHCHQEPLAPSRSPATSRVSAVPPAGRLTARAQPVPRFGVGRRIEQVLVAPMVAVATPQPTRHQRAPSGGAAWALRAARSGFVGRFGRLFWGRGGERISKYLFEATSCGATCTETTRRAPPPLHPELRPRPSTATLRRPGRGAAAAGRRRAQRRRRQRPAGVAWRAAPPPASPPRQRRRTSCSARCPRPTLAASASSRRRRSPGNSTRTTRLELPTL